MPGKPQRGTQAQVMPAAERNKGPILDVLRTTLPSIGHVLEVASGSGQHVVHFASALRGLVWHPSDPDAEARASIEAWRESAALRNLRAPVALDTRTPDWSIECSGPLVAVVCVNMIHISPWASYVGLVEGASRLLAPGGALVLYGPFSIGGRWSAASNIAFDRSLRERNPEWGVRDLDDVTEVARSHRFVLERVVDMPADNSTVVFRRTEAG